VIDDGASTTATTSAVLSLYGTGAYTMQLSNSSDFSSSTWIPYSTVLPWTLTSGDGIKTVTVNYRNVQGTAIGSASDTIDLVTGQVLGASTGSGASCGLYLYKYIKLGSANDPVEVKKLQTFLNQELGTHLTVTGYYGLLSYAAVQQFQLKYNQSVLAPWVPYGLPSATDPTGYVFKTTRRMINNIVCPPLNLPLPNLSSSVQ
jgi:peptidoglycan hydrolase-like protein with peptidoglycan-binding domain